MAMLVLTSAGVAAQTAIEETFTDDFEDGDVKGWSNPVDGQAAREVSQNSTNGQYSLHTGSDMLSQQPQPSIFWDTGPVLDMSEDFVVTGTVKVNNPGDGPSNIRIGIPGDDQSVEGQNAFLIFDLDTGETYLSTSVDQGPSGASTKYNTAFNNVWVNYEIRSAAGNDTLKAKVWEVGASEPDSYITRSGFDGISGRFAVNPGYADTNNRQMWLDDVQIEGQRATDPMLTLNTRELFAPGSTHEYTVRETRYQNGMNRSYIVTDNATVESLNTSLLTVNDANNTLTANQSAGPGAVTIRAQYNNSTTYKEVVVAEPTVQNLAILPTFTWRINAVLGDSFFQALLVSLFVGVATTRYTSAFGGLSASQVMLTVGWFAGYVPWVFGTLGLFLALFIGLNLAANIDYSVRKG